MEHQLPEVKVTGDVSMTPALLEHLQKKLDNKLGRLGQIQEIHFIISSEANSLFKIKGLIRRAGKEYCQEIIEQDVYNAISTVTNKLHEQLTA